MTYIHHGLPNGTPLAAEEDNRVTSCQPSRHAKATSTIKQVSRGLTLFGKVLQEAFVKQPAQLPVQVKHCWHTWSTDLGLGDTPTKAPPRKWMNLTLEHMLHSVFDGLNVHVDSTVFLHLRCFGRSTDSSGRNNQCTQICRSPLNPKTSMRVQNSCVGLIHPKALRTLFVAFVCICTRFICLAD